MPGRVTFKKGAKLDRIEKRLEDPSAALKKIGILMVAETQRAFREQRFGGTSWEQRAPVNVFGILSDFAQGKRKPPGRRFERRPALRDTGRLANSFSFVVRGDVVEVGTNVEYAAVLHRGGETESVPITPSLRRSLWSWLKKQGPDIKRRMGWVLNRKFEGQKLKQKVPARPFIGITDNTRKAVRKVVGVEIMEVG